MHSTRLYREQHTRIRALCQPLLRSQRGSVSSPVLRSSLAKLAGSVKVHFRDEDERLYPRLVHDGDPAVRDLANTFRTTMGGLSAEFSRFYNEWVVPGAIESDAARFFAETDRVLNALLQRIEREDTELYDLADRAAKERPTR